MVWTIAMKRGALALWLVGAVAGVAGAQVIMTPPPFPPLDTRSAGFCNGGLFTLSGNTARLYVALDADSSESNIFVLMRFINHVGKVVQSKIAEIGPGRSSMLDYSGIGLVRPQIQLAEPSLNFISTDRRTVVPSAEIFDVDDLIAPTVIPPPVCTVVGPRPG